MSWSVDDLLSTPAENQKSSCGLLFSSVCAFDSDTLTDLVFLPPSAPPPPMLPITELTPITTVRVLAAGGFETDSSQQLDDCTDASGTVCEAVEHERPVSCRRPHIESIAIRS